MARYHEYYKNSEGESVSVLDVDTSYVVWNHEHAVEIGHAGDPENARQMIEG